MSSWSEAPVRPVGRGAVLRGAVLRGSDAEAARPARMDAELRTSPFASAYGVDPRLTDPHLQDVVATARRSAVEQGTAEGHRAGYAAGMALAAAEAAVAAEQAAQVAAADEARRESQLDNALALLATAADAFRQRETTALAEIEDTVTDLALQIARAVLDREVAASENPGREAVARALTLAPRDCPATVRVSPADAASLGDLETLGAGRHLVVVADPTIEPGGCVVDAAGRQVDAQIGPALKRVADALQGSRR
jgi:flagellar assembly protein FliH